MITIPDLSREISRPYAVAAVLIWGAGFYVDYVSSIAGVLYGCYLVAGAIFVLLHPSIDIDTDQFRSNMVRSYGEVALAMALWILLYLSLGKGDNE